MKMSERDELLIRLDERTDSLEKRSVKQEMAMENHLEHHFRYSIMAWTIAIGAIITAVSALCKLRGN